MALPLFLEHHVYRFRETRHELFATRVEGGDDPHPVVLAPERKDDRQLWEVRFHADGGYYTIRNLHGGDEFLSFNYPPKHGAGLISHESRRWTIKPAGRGDTYTIEVYDRDQGPAFSRFRIGSGADKSNTHRVTLEDTGYPTDQFWEFHVHTLPGRY